MDKTPPPQVAKELDDLHETMQEQLENLRAIKGARFASLVSASFAFCQASEMCGILSGEAEMRGASKVFLETICSAFSTAMGAVMRAGFSDIPLEQHEEAAAISMQLMERKQAAQARLAKGL